jgi:hypothetical protein
MCYTLAMAESQKCNVQETNPRLLRSDEACQRLFSCGGDLYAGAVATVA